MGILKDLYHGKSGYFGETRIDTAEYILNAAKVAELEEKLTGNHPEITELFEKYQNAQSAVASITEYEMFAAGFRTGAQLMLEMLKPMD